MERIVMTWGFIPTECVSETIFCGDAETSGTIELNFEIIGDTCKGIDNDFKVEFESNELWDPGSELYYAISVYLSAAFDKTVMPSLIYGAYALVNDEPDDYSSSFEIIDSTAGVFINEGQILNGKVFLRHYFEEDDEIYDEKVCVGTL
jgi:hypothetical protein